jgi:baseplate J-like protein
MSNTTNVPDVQFTPTGLVIPQESAILSGVQQDQNAAFGGNLNPALTAPQGQLATSTTAIVANANTTFATFVNQVDPDTATGFMQDAIARIYFLTRNPALPTAVNLQCVGVFGTPIPVGAQAQDTSGNIYLCTQAGVIPVGGTITLPFAAQVAGPTACPANTVTQIYQAIPGWDTVNNSSAGVAGANVETPAAFEYRREQSVGINAQGSLPAIYAKVFSVPNVIDAFVTQNNTDSVQSGGLNGNPNSSAFPVAARSIFVAVVGGASQAIANAIWVAANIGPGYQTAAGSAGATLVTESVQDTSGYQNPIPTYSVGFIIAAPTPIFFAVQLANNANLPANIIPLVQQAIVASFTGTDGSLRARIGATILASKFYAPVSLIGPEVSILSILIGFTAIGDATQNSLQMGIDQAPTILASNIVVTLI